MRNVQNRGGNTELSSVLVHGFREVGEIVVRIVDELNVIIHGSILVELLGLITCGEGELGQVARLLVLVRSAFDLRALLGRESSARRCGWDGQRGRRSRSQEWSRE